MQHVSQLISEFIATQSDGPPIKVGIIGDIILDEYYEVKVDRISPESPVPIITSHCERPTYCRPGGAANVAFQLQHFNAEYTLFGCVDEPAKNILSTFNFRTYSADHGGRCPRKRRLSQNGHPLQRWDIEDLSNFESEGWCKARKTILEKIEMYCYGEEPDIIILSDYGKGFFTGNTAQEIIEMCAEYDIAVLVDPKDEPLEQWRGCTIFKPNTKEISSFCESRRAYPHNLISLLDCEVIVQTDGEKGVSVFKPNDPTKHIQHDIAVKVESVVGAGDCFAAIYALAYACNFNNTESATIAHYAGLAYVQHQDSSPIHPNEIIQLINPAAGKCCTPKELNRILKSKSGTTVFTNGCFDILHEGHLETLNFAKQQGDILIVAVDTDQNVQKLKGPDRPIKTLKERMNILAQLTCVDFVVPFNGTPDQLLKLLPKMDVLVKGGDYSVDTVIGADLVGQVVICPLKQGYSTTDTLKRIRRNV